MRDKVRRNGVLPVMSRGYCPPPRSTADYRERGEAHADRLFGRTRQHGWYLCCSASRLTGGYRERGEADA
jgi:hypothetical protein